MTKLRQEGRLMQQATNGRDNAGGPPQDEEERVERLRVAFAKNFGGSLNS